MNKKKTTIAALVLSLIVIIGGTIAYFTDTDDATNTFTIGSVDITLSEPNWVESSAQNVMPGEEILKDPTITNSSTTNKAYVFMKVEAPCTTSSPVTELFPYTVNSGWYTLSNGACTGGTATRVYAYGSSSAMTELAVGASTPALFSKVTVANLNGTESGITGNKDMVITAYGIQVDGLSSADPNSVWSNFN